MENLPTYVSTVFILTTGLTLFFLFKAAHQSKRVLTVSVLWLVLIFLIALTGFYEDTTRMPPSLAFLIGPPTIFILVLFLTPKGKDFLDKIDPRWINYLHVVRFPVEIVLFLLFTYQYIPEIMTFEGRNFDVLSGITAPFVVYFGYTKLKINRTVLLIWNFICLALLFNIVTIAILCAPFPFQQLAFDQPNVAVFYFPFVWLPGFVVPAVLFSHLVSIRKLRVTLIQRELNAR